MLLIFDSHPEFFTYIFTYSESDYIIHKDLYIAFLPWCYIMPKHPERDNSYVTYAILKHRNWWTGSQL